MKKSILTGLVLVVCSPIVFASSIEDSLSTLSPQSEMQDSIIISPSDTIKISQEIIDGSIEQAKAYASDFSFDKAIELLEDLWQRDSTSVELIRELESLYYKTSQYEKALSMTDRVLKGENASRYYLVHKGILLKKIGEYGQALDIFKEALETDSSNVFIINHVADLFQVQNERDSALFYYTRGCELKPLTSSIIKSVNMLLKADRSSEAYEFFSKFYTKEHYGNKMLRRLYGKTLYLNDSINLSKAVFSTLYEQGDSSRLTTKFLGMSHWKLEEYAKGQKVFMEYLKQDSTDYQSYFFLGTCCMHNYYLDEGEVFLNKSLDLIVPDGQTLNLIYSELGNLYERKRDFHRAIDVYQMMLENDPMCFYAEYKMAKVYDYDLKEDEKALKWYTTLLKRAEASNEANPTDQALNYTLICKSRISKLKEEQFWDSDSNNKGIIVEEE
ncbi:hypothetical protein DMA11_21750 [Marinilabiliaceae bacterium JC017]|nr:hypothetical protein DMA11_21750 [Marinilabiliaceae bacterium JC017]